MKTIAISVFTSAIALLLSCYGAEMQISTNVSGLTASGVIQKFRELSGLELVVASNVKNAADTPVIVETFHGLHGKPLKEVESIRLIEQALLEQAGIIITRLDNNRASVTYNDAIPVVKPGELQPKGRFFRDPMRQLDAPERSERPSGREAFRDIAPADSFARFSGLLTEDDLLPTRFRIMSRPPVSVPSIRILPEDVVQESVLHSRHAANKHFIMWSYTEAGAMKILAFREAHEGKETQRVFGEFETPPSEWIFRPTQLSTNYAQFKENWLKRRVEWLFVSSDEDAKTVTDALKSE